MNSSVSFDTTIAGPPPPSDGEPGRCELLGPFALFVQGALGALALLVLLWKRSREHPQRPLLIWFMDVSKQVIGSGLVHIANLVLSMLSSGTFSTEPTPTSVVIAGMRMLRRQDGPGGGGGGPGDEAPHHSNPCSFYLLNLGIDTTVGVVILIYALRMLHKIIERFSIPGLRTGMVSGYYGEPPKWMYWMKQSSVYFAGLMVMKFIVGLLFALFPWLGMVGDFLLSWTEGNKKVQVFFVMFFFPLVMNAFQYYVIDSFIKAKVPSQDVIRDGTPIDDEPELHHPRRSFNYTEEASDSDPEDGSKRLLYPSRPPQRNPTSKKPSGGTYVEEYDPNYDGTSDNANATRRGSPESGYFKPGSRKTPTVGSQKSRNSSMLLLPGSRGPSTPGYADEENNSISTGRGSGHGKMILGDDDSTLVEHEEQ